jgi:hypothetical protein
VARTRALGGRAAAAVGLRPARKASLARAVLLAPPTAPELTMSDGRKVKIPVPGLAPGAKPGRTEERRSAEPPRDDPRPIVNPDRAGL